MSHQFLDLSDCAKEPIHLSGKIQEWGAIVCFNSSLQVSHFSENISDYFKVHQKHSDYQLVHFLSSQNLELLKSKLVEAKSSEVYLRFDEKITLAGRLHFYNDCYYLEVEPFKKVATDLTIYLHPLVSRIQEASSLDDLFKHAVNGIMHLTEYEKVMIYKFHPDDHGEVIAEAKQEGIESFLGFHYPSSDIPSQARHLFLASWVRMIPDVDYTPVPLISAAKNSIPDLSRAALRSVSPIHIEYLQNMKVRASLTISIIVEGKLWGLVACHQYSSPKFQAKEVRLACEILGRALSANIERRILKEAKAQYDLSENLRNLPSAASIISLFSDSEFILEMLKPEVTGAAAFYDGQWYLAGKTPGKTELGSLISWLNEQNNGSPLFFTDSLPDVYPDAINFKDIGSGILSISFKKNSKDFLIWFKPEVIQSIKWAGNPDKMANLDADNKMHPRKSFADFMQVVELHSLPWLLSQQNHALKLRTHILDVELQRYYQNEIDARKVAEKLLNELQEKSRELEDQRIKSIYAAKMSSLGEMASGVAHEINNPLAIITTTCLRLKQQLNENKLEPHELKGFIQEIHHTSDRISSLIKGLNFFLGDSKSTAKEVVLLSKILDEVVTVSMEKLNTFGCRLEVNIEPDLKLLCQQVNLAQIFMNLLSNSLDAVKEQNSPWIKIRAFKNGSTVRIEFTDSGNGIPEELRSKVMEPFFTTKPAGKGSGLGLSMARKFVEEHNGQISVDTKAENTCFILDFPGV